MMILHKGNRKVLKCVQNANIITIKKITEDIPFNKIDDTYNQVLIIDIGDVTSNIVEIYKEIFLDYLKTGIIKKKFLPIFSKHEIIARGDFLATGTVYKREIIKNFNFYNEKTKNCGLENYELILKLISDKKKGKKIDKFLFFYRMHKKNISVIKEKKITSYGKKLFTKMNLQQYSKNQFHPWV